MPTKTTAVKDELDSILGNEGAPTDAPAEEGYNFDQEFAQETEEVGYDAYDDNLGQARRLDFRVLKNRTWYDADIVGWTRDVSKAGNPQIVCILEVTAPSEPGETSEGAPVVGINVTVYVPTPRPPLDKKAIASLWTLKDIAGAVGLADFNAAGEVARVKPGTKDSDFIGRSLRFRNEVDDKYDPQNPRNKAGAFCAPRAAATGTNK